MKLEIEISDTDYEKLKEWLDGVKWIYMMPSSYSGERIAIQKIGVK